MRSESEFPIDHYTVFFNSILHQHSLTRLPPAKFVTNYISNQFFRCIILYLSEASWTRSYCSLVYKRSNLVKEQSATSPNPTVDEIFFIKWIRKKSINWIWWYIIPFGQNYCSSEIHRDCAITPCRIGTYTKVIVNNIRFHCTVSQSSGDIGSWWRDTTVTCWGQLFLNCSK